MGIFRWRKQKLSYGIEYFLFNYYLFQSNWSLKGDTNSNLASCFVYLVKLVLTSCIMEYIQWVYHLFYGTHSKSFALWRSKSFALWYSMEVADKIMTVAFWNASNRCLLKILLADAKHFRQIFITLFYKSLMKHEIPVLFALLSSAWRKNSGGFPNAKKVIPPFPFTCFLIFWGNSKRSVPLFSWHHLVACIKNFQ